MNASLLRRLVAEFVGTAILVLFGAGSVVAATDQGNGTLDYAGLGIVSLAFGFAVTLAVFTVGTISGAHINPAVTIALAVVRRFTWAEVAPYIVAQLAGAVAGALLIVAYAGDRAASSAKMGLTSLATGVSAAQGALAEGLGTFLLLFVVMAVAVDRRAPAGWAGFIIGLAVATEIMVIGPFTGGSVNPARSFGPYLVNQLFGGSTPWSQYWIYIAGPLVGGALAAICYELMARPGPAVAPLDADADADADAEGAASAKHSQT